MPRSALRYTAAVVLVGSLLVTACHSYRPATGPVLPASRVRLRFDPPRTVRVALSGGEAYEVPGVTTVEGQVLALRGDTLELALQGGRRMGRTDRSEDDPALGMGSVAVVLSPSVSVERRESSDGGAARVLAGVALAAAFLVVVALVVVSSIVPTD